MSAGGQNTTLVAADACAALVDRVIAPVRDSPARVLDVGCGLGAATQALARVWPHARIVGIGNSDRQLQHCRLSVPQATFFYMDATRLGFANRSYDLVVAVESALHFDRSLFFSEAYRVLDERGSFVFSDLLYLSPDTPGAWTVPEQNIGSDLNQYVHLLRSAGFTDIELADVTSMTWQPFVAHLRAYCENLDPAVVGAASWRGAADALATGPSPVAVIGAAQRKRVL